VISNHAPSRDSTHDASNVHHHIPSGNARNGHTRGCRRSRLVTVRGGKATHNCSTTHAFAAVGRR